MAAHALVKGSEGTIFFWARPGELPELIWKKSYEVPHECFILSLN